MVDKANEKYTNSSVEGEDQTVRVILPNENTR